jgi:antitoxin component of RelBE/YafQ-DinJ toxin-antitoxin module
MFRRLVLTVVTVAATAMGGLVVAPATAVDPPTTLQFACALKSSGLLRAVTALSQCNTKKETAVTFGVAAPVTVCFKPDTTVRLGRCSGAGTTATIPSNTPRYFCTDTAPANRILKWVSSPTLCASGTLPFVVGNSAPTALALTPSSVAENEPAGTTVGTLSATDPDIGDTFTFALVAGTGSTDNASFQITGATLETNASFDFETKSSYSIRVRVTDRLGLTREQAFTVTVTDVFENGAPTDITLSDAQVDENAPSGTTVGTLGTTDPNATDTHTYTLAVGTGDADNGLFQIDGSALETGQLFDFETDSSYSVRIRTDDGAGGTFEKQLTISVVDKPERPTDIALNPSSVEEGTDSGTTVGELSAVDPDAGDSHFFSIVPGDGATDNGLFAIVSGTLVIYTVPDYETKTSYSVRLSATDKAGLTFEKALTITVTDVADSNSPPTDIRLSDANVDENEAAGTGVGTLSTTDPDASDTHTYTLVAGIGDTDNGSFQIDGTTLETNTVLDFEAQATYSVRVQTDDGRGGTFAKELTITLSNRNDPPVATTDSYSTPVGNTLAVLGTTGIGPHITLTGDVLADNDTDQDVPAQPLSVVPETVSTTGGGSVRIGSDGSFSYLPGVGDKNQTDTFTYRVTDGFASSAGTVNISIDNSAVWYVDDSAAAGGDGRSNAPLNSLAPVSGAGGAGDADGMNDVLFLYSGSYGGGVVLENGQRLVGEPEGLVVGPASGLITVVEAGGTSPAISNTGGAGVTLANLVSISGVTVSGSTDGIVGSGITSAVIRRTTVDGYGDNGLEVVNVSGSSSVVVQTSTFKNGSATTGGDGIHLEANGSASMNVNVASSTFANNRHDHFVFVTDSTGTGTNGVTFTGNVLTGDRGSAFGGDDLGAGIAIRSSTGSRTIYAVSNNNIQGAVGSPVRVVMDSETTSEGIMSGAISGNTIGDAAVEASGGSADYAIYVLGAGAGAATVTVNNNVIRQNRSTAAINIFGSSGTSSMAATVTGNNVAASTGIGLSLQSGAGSPGGTGITCAAISSNTLQGGPLTGPTDFRLQQLAGSTIRLPGYSGSATDTTAVRQFVLANNIATTGSVLATVPPGGGFVGGASCPSAVG